MRTPPRSPPTRKRLETPEDRSFPAFVGMHRSMMANIYGMSFMMTPPPLPYSRGNSKGWRIQGLRAPGELALERRGADSAAPRAAAAGARAPQCGRNVLPCGPC